MALRPRTVRPRRHRAVLGVVLLTAGLATSVASGEIGGQAADAATPGLSITPATGTTNGSPISVTIPKACPAATTKYSVSISGAGFAAGSNIIGLNDFIANSTGPFNGGGNWDAVAGNNPGTTIAAGTANIELLCIDTSGGEETVAETYAGSVVFTTGTAGAFTYTAGGAAVATPTPTPPATPTPSAVSPTPAPDADATPTPTPDANATPTPTPCSKAEGAPGCSTADSDTDAGSGANAAGALPDTGAKDPAPLVILSIMLSFAGGALLLLEAACRPREDWL